MRLADPTLRPRLRRARAAVARRRAVPGDIDYQRFRAVVRARSCSGRSPPCPGRPALDRQGHALRAAGAPSASAQRERELRRRRPGAALAWTARPPAPRRWFTATRTPGEPRARRRRRSPSSSATGTSTKARRPAPRCCAGRRAASRGSRPRRARPRRPAGVTPGGSAGAGRARCERRADPRRALAAHAGALSVPRRAQRRRPARPARDGHAVPRREGVQRRARPGDHRRHGGGDRGAGLPAGAEARPRLATTASSASSSTPTRCVARREIEDEDGVVHAYDEVLAGEAMSGGPVMLSWRDVADAGESAADGYNVVIHEFAHVIDMRDGVTADGVNRPMTARERGRWLRALADEYERLRRPHRRGRGNLPRPLRRRSAGRVLRRRAPRPSSWRRTSSRPSCRDLRLAQSFFQAGPGTEPGRPLVGVAPASCPINSQAPFVHA